MVMTDTQAAAVRQLRRLNGREDLRSLVANFITEAERELIDQPADELARVEFLKLRELRDLLFGA